MGGGWWLLGDYFSHTSTTIDASVGVYADDIYGRDAHMGSENEEQAENEWFLHMTGVRRNRIDKDQSQSQPLT